MTIILLLAMTSSGHARNLSLVFYLKKSKEFRGVRKTKIYGNETYLMHITLNKTQFIRNIFWFLVGAMLSDPPESLQCAVLSRYLS